MENRVNILQGTRERTKRIVYVLGISPVARAVSPSTPAPDVARRAAGAVHWLLVEEVKTYRFREGATVSGATLQPADLDSVHPDDIVLDDVSAASVVINYWTLSDGSHDTHQPVNGMFSAKYTRPHPHDGWLEIHRPGLLRVDPPELQHFRLGPYLQDRITRWAMGWEKADVRTVTLNEAQAPDEDSKQSRNRFWRRYGFRFKFSDSTERAGVSLPMSAASLCVPDAPPAEQYYAHIQRIDVASRWVDLAVQVERARLSERAAHGHLVELLDMERAGRTRPTRWAMSGKLRRRAVALLEGSKARRSVGDGGAAGIDPAALALPTQNALAALSPDAVVSGLHQQSLQIQRHHITTMGHEQAIKRLGGQLQRMIDHPWSWDRGG